MRLKLLQCWQVVARCEWRMWSCDAWNRGRVGLRGCILMGTDIWAVVKTLTHTIHVWYIYLHLVDFLWYINVGKYINPMDPMGIFRFKSCGNEACQDSGGRLWQLTLDLRYSTWKKTWDPGSPRVLWIWSNYSDFTRPHTTSPQMVA